MKRFFAALVLSLLLHMAAVLMIPAHEKDEPAPKIIRVTLRELPSHEKQNPVPPMTGAVAGHLTPPAKAEIKAKKDDIEKIKPPEAENTPKLSKPKPKPAPVKPPRETPVSPEPPRESAIKESAGDAQDKHDTTPPASGTEEKRDAGSAASGSGGGGASKPGRASAVWDVAELTVAKKVQPEYPMISRRRKDQGRVVLLITLVSGKVSSVEIEKSSGHSALDESAAKAARQWKFDLSGVGRADGGITVRIPFEFMLK